MNNRLLAKRRDDWALRHNQALVSNVPEERRIVDLIEAWMNYADVQKQLYDSDIGQDGFLGDVWAQIGSQMRQLLNMECGRLDCGTLDSAIYDLLKEQGFDPDQL